MQKPNKLFPGRPNYVGPKEGYFAMLHHTVLFEYGEDVMERAAYIRSHKPKNEVKVRLLNMISLADCPVLNEMTRIERVIKQMWDTKLLRTGYTSEQARAIEHHFQALAASRTELKRVCAVFQSSPYVRKLVRAYIKQVYPKHAWIEKKGKGNIRGT
jgi:hypothetical protein